MTSQNEPFNFLSPENGVLLAHCSSQTATCPARNVLLAEKRAIWISDQGLPQSLVIDMTNIIKRPKFFKCFGFYCWHDYPSNPSVVELLVSTDGEKFITWTVVHAELRAGVQLFPMDPLGSRYNFLKVVIKETFGASKTYLNQLLLFEENPLNISQSNPIITESPIMSTTRANAQQKKKNALEDMLSNRSPINGNQDQRSAPNKRKSVGSYYTAPNHPVHKTSQSQILDYDQTERGNITSQAGTRPRVDRDPSFMPQPNFENQAGQFLSPVQDIFTNPNLSLLQETALRSPIDNQNLQVRNVKPFLDQTSARIHEPNISTPHSNIQQNFGPNKNQLNMQSPQEFSGQQQHYPEFVNKTPVDVRSSIKNQQGDYSANIHSFGNEHKKEGIQQGPQDRETFNATDNNNNEVDLPLLTHSEKEVKQMKQEMKKWGVTMSAMQDNMNKLLEKVSSLHDTIDISKSQEKPQKRQSLPKTFQEDTARSEQNRQNNQVNNYLEDFREDILGYLENVANQNQVILHENQKLRQDLEHLMQTRHSTTKGYQDVNTSHNEPTYYSTQDQSARDIERVVTHVFDKNIRAWENIFYAQMKTQTDLLEDRVTHKLGNAIDSIKDREQAFKQKVLDELAHLENKIAATKVERILETRGSPVHRSPIPPMKDRSAVIREETNTYSYTNEPTSHIQTTSFANRGNTVLDETRRATPAHRDVRRPITSPKSVLKNSTYNTGNTGTVEKVQYLMAKLQEKIAIRDEKVKALQRSVSSTSSYGENFTPNRKYVDRSYQD